MAAATASGPINGVPDDRGNRSDGQATQRRVGKAPHALPAARKEHGHEDRKARTQRDTGSVGPISGTSARQSPISTRI